MPSVLANVDLDRLDAPAHDCIQVNLSALADAYHGTGTHLRLGSRLDFAPQAGPDGLPTVEPGLPRRVEQAAELLGLVADGPLAELPGPRLAELLTTDPVYVVGDAFDLPWVPYHGRQHLEHSFLMTAGPRPGEALVLDAYHNETRWGPARPARWTVPVPELVATVGRTLRTVRMRPAGLPVLPVADALAANAAQLRDAANAGEIERYVLAYRQHPDLTAATERLTLETWLLARSRRLHAHWLAAADPDRATPFTEQAGAWAGLAEHVYIALRRVQRGRPAPPGLTDRLRELLLTDVRLARTLVQEDAWTPTPSSRP